MIFKNINDNLSQEIASRLVIKNRIIPFGLSYLDDSCLGFTPNDLLLIGARSGAGKTQICINFAINAMKNGKKVYFFALEADPQEIEKRLKFEIYQELYKQKYHGKMADFQRWSFGFHLPDDMDLELKTIEIFQEKYPTGLFTFYKTGDFTVFKMVEMIMSAKDADLIIIDHVHYFDFDDDNENRAIKLIAKTARDLVIENKVPIVLVSHMRKGNARGEGFAPSLEDFHGSSDLFKIATRAITIGAGDYDANGTVQTYFHVVKNRFDSSVTRFIGRMHYNYAKGTYEEGYEVGKCYQKREGEFETLIGDDLPKFVRPSVRRASLLHANDSTPRISTNHRGPKIGSKLQEYLNK